jgi:serine/threonine-protein kinase
VPLVAGPATGLSGDRTQVFGAATAAAAAAAAAGSANAATGALPMTGATALAGAGSPLTGPGRALPPLHAPEHDDWIDDDDLPPAGAPARGRWLWVAAAVAVLLVLAGGAWFLLGRHGTSGNTATSTSASQSTAGPTGIYLDPARFIGRPEADVRKELTDAGLIVAPARPAARVMLIAAGRPLDPGDVAGLDPQKIQAKPGTTVTVYVARNGYTPGGTSTATSSAPAPTSATRTTAPTASASRTSSPAPTSVSVPSTPTTTATTLSTQPASSASAPASSPGAGASGAGVSP